MTVDKHKIIKKSKATNSEYITQNYLLKNKNCLNAT